MLQMNRDVEIVLKHTGLPINDGAREPINELLECMPIWCKSSQTAIAALMYNLGFIQGKKKARAKQQAALLNGKNCTVKIDELLANLPRGSALVVMADGSTHIAKVTSI